MELTRLFSFVLPLGCDTLAVALALGMRGSAWLRPAIVFAAFETAMPVFGIFAGRFVGERFTVAAQLLGGSVLFAVALHAWREAFEDEDEGAGLRFDSLRTAALAGVAISTDELAVGFPLGAAHLPVAALLFTIGAQTFVMTAAGITVGRRLGNQLGRRASRYAGIGAAVAFGGLGVSLIVEAFRR